MLFVSRLGFSTIDFHDETDNSVAQLISLATSSDNLARMDPAWHPWL